MSAINSIRLKSHFPFASNSAPIAALLLLNFSLAHPRTLLSQAAEPGRPEAASHLQRHYRDGETVAYKMEGANQGHVRTVRYTATAKGLVSRNTSGVFVEEFSWADLTVNGGPFALSPASLAFRQQLSLAPDYRLNIPDLSSVQPILIGPITDLLTFYADVQTALRQATLVRAGDHVYMKHGLPNSWADGTYVVFGQDAIDFDITLQSLDKTKGVATFIVRHVPPAESQIKFPAEWMRAPVAASPNNWAEVEKVGDGSYTAEVGSETFEVKITVDSTTGRILSASMDNPVQVLERDCTDAALAACGASRRYEIGRQISLQEIPGPANNAQK